MSDYADSLAEFNADKNQHQRELIPASIEFLADRGKLIEVAFGMATITGQPSEHSPGLDILRAGMMEAPKSLTDRGAPLRIGGTFVIRSCLRDHLLIGTKWQIFKLDHTPLETVVKATCQRIEEG